MTDDSGTSFPVNPEEKGARCRVPKPFRLMSSRLTRCRQVGALSLSLSLPDDESFLFRPHSVPLIEADQTADAFPLDDRSSRSYRQLCARASRAKRGIP